MAAALDTLAKLLRAYDRTHPGVVARMGKTEIAQFAVIASQIDQLVADSALNPAGPLWADALIDQLFQKYHDVRAATNRRAAGRLTAAKVNHAHE